jgi:isopenicillin N synthase-like dioxygenase
VGMMLASYSNDRVRTTPHRVINRNDASHTRSQSSSAS